MLEPFLIKLQTLRTAIILEGDSCETCKIFKNTLFYWTSPVAASGCFRFPPCNFIKKEIPAKTFSVNFAKFLRTSFDRALPDDCFLSLSVNFENFFRTSLLQNTSEKPLISSTSRSISISRYSEKLFRRC